MLCIKCDNKKNIKAKSIFFDYSDKSGIDGCSISAKQYTCPKCKNVVVDLGDDDEVNEAICEVILRADPMTRKMIKYIRTHVFQETLFQFSKRLETNPTYYGEVEQFKRPLSKALIMSVKDQIEKKFMLKGKKEISLFAGNKKTTLKL